MNTEISTGDHGVTMFVTVGRDIFDLVFAEEDEYDDDYWMKVIHTNNVTVVFTTYERST